MIDKWLTHQDVPIFFALTLVAAIGGCKEPAGSAPPERAQAVDFAAAIELHPRYDAAAHAIVVEVSIAPGFHAYAEGETVGRPLKLEVAGAEPIELSGAPRYPAGREKMLPIGRSMVVEGKSEIVAPIVKRGTTEAPSAGTPFKANLSYQVCKETACDRPRTLEIQLST
ncbi:MAG: protein-disulfide reductase DsbD family protein [Myxococcota bacterium]